MMATFIKNPTIPLEDFLASRTLPKRESYDGGGAALLTVIIINII